MSKVKVAGFSISMGGFGAGHGRRRHVLFRDRRSNPYRFEKIVPYPKTLHSPDS